MIASRDAGELTDQERELNAKIISDYEYQLKNLHEVLSHIENKLFPLLGDMIVF